MKEKTNIVPYEPGEAVDRNAYVREKDLSNGGHVRLARFTEPAEDGHLGITLTYLSPEKDGKRTKLCFSLSDEAAAQTCFMLSEFFGFGICA